MRGPPQSDAITFTIFATRQIIATTLNVNIYVAVNGTWRPLTIKRVLNIETEIMADIQNIHDNVPRMYFRFRDSGGLKIIITVAIIAATRTTAMTTIVGPFAR